MREYLSAEVRHAPRLIDDLGGVTLLPILLIEFYQHVDLPNRSHQTVLVDKAADLRLSQRLQMQEVYRNVISDLPHEPFVMLHREPVSCAPAVVAVAGRVE